MTGPSSHVENTGFMFELSQLRCFVAVAEELHFGRAALRLNMTQPPLSRQIQILERVLDVTLLERSNRAVRLTPAGQRFLTDARHLLKLAESAAVLARRMAERQGRIDQYRLHRRPPPTATCRRWSRPAGAQLPDIEISLKEMVSSDQLKRLDSGEIDIALLRPPIPRGNLGAFRVTAEPLIAALPSGHPLAQAAQLRLEDLAGEPFIMYAPYEARYFHDLLVELFSRAASLAPGLCPAPRADPFDPGHRAFRRRRRTGAGSGTRILQFSSEALRPLARSTVTTHSF